MFLSDVAVGGDSYCYEEYLRSHNLRMMTSPVRSISSALPMMIYRLMWTGKTPFVTTTGTDLPGAVRDTLDDIRVNCPEKSCAPIYVVNSNWRIKVRPHEMAVIREVLGYLEKADEIMRAPVAIRGPFLVEMMGILEKVEVGLPRICESLEHVLIDPLSKTDKYLPKLRTRARRLQFLSSRGMIQATDDELSFVFPLVIGDLRPTYLEGLAREPTEGSFCITFADFKLTPYKLPEQDWLIDMIIESTPGREELPAPETT